MIDNNTENGSSFNLFFKKTFLICMVIILILGFIFESLKFPMTDKSKLILIGFINNPTVLYKISQIDESRGKISLAINEIECAIGLLELHGASDKSISKFEKRLEILKSKL